MSPLVSPGLAEGGMAFDLESASCRGSREGSQVSAATASVTGNDDVVVVVVYQCFISNVMIPLGFKALLYSKVQAVLD